MDKLIKLLDKYKKLSNDGLLAALRHANNQDEIKVLTYLLQERGYTNEQIKNQLYVDRLKFREL